MSTLDVDKTRSTRTDQIIFWGGAIVYGIICGLGTINADFGLVGIFGFALIGSIISIIRNLGLVLAMVAIGIASAAFPPLGVVALVVVVILSVRRIKFFVVHLQVIVLGILAYLGASAIIYVDLVRNAFDQPVLWPLINAVIGGYIFSACCAVQ